jgi:Cu/Ag efflux pump CusA
MVLQALGYSLNALVALGLLVAAAVVVDDAVGASHQIARRMRERSQLPGVEPVRDVVLHAFVSLRSTLGYATLIALLSAAPVLFSKGLSATFLHPMMLAFAIAVLSSSVVALTITPALGMLLFERARPRHRAAELANRVLTRYELVLRQAITLPTAALACVCAAGFVGAVSIPFLSQPSTPTFKDRNLVVQWNGPAGASLAEMDRITARTVAELRALPSVSDVAATLGRAVSADQIVDTSSGQIFVTLRHSADYASAEGQVRAIAEGTPGIRASVGTYERDVLGGVLAPARSDVTVRLYGEDYGQLRSLATQVQGLISHVSGLGRPQVQLPAQEPNIEVAVNDGAALRAGVLPGDARREASTLVSGLTVGNFFEDQAVFDVVVQGVAAVRGSVDTVRNLLIDTSRGGHVRLGTIAQVGVHSDPIDIQHQALSRFVDVSAPVYSGDVAAAKAAVQAKLGQVTFPLQYHAEVVGGTPDDPTSHVVFLSYVLAAAIGVLLLLQAALRSWRLAALLFLALPVSLAGGLIVALATGQWGSLGTDAGLLGVFAFAARQGMLQLAGIRRAHEQQRQSLTAAIVGRAASERFASSLASTITVAVALLPFVVIGDAAGNELTHVAAAVMLGGLASTLLLNLILLPAMALAFGPTEPVAAVDLYEEPVDAPGLAPTPSPS